MRLASLALLALACTSSTPPDPSPTATVAPPDSLTAPKPDTDTDTDTDTDADTDASTARPSLETTSTGDPPVQHVVPSRDDHPVTVWSKRPDSPKGSFLLVHGRTWSGLPNFDLQVEGEHLSLMDRLVERGWAAYAVDLRGYGATDRDDDGWIDPDEAAADTVAAMRFIAEREGTPPVVLGWSFGAIHANIAVQRQPDLARALVLYGNPRGPRGRSTPEPDPAAPQRARNTRNAARSDFITRGTITEHAIQTYVEACHAADPVRADWYRLHLFDEADASKLTVPTLSIRGDGDPVASASTQRRFVAAVPVESRYVEIANADHAAHLEHPGVFVNEVLGFVEQAAPSPASRPAPPATEEPIPQGGWEGRRVRSGH